MGCLCETVAARSAPDHAQPPSVRAGGENGCWRRRAGDAAFSGLNFSIRTPPPREGRGNRISPRRVARQPAACGGSIEIGPGLRGPAEAAGHPGPAAPSRRSRLTGGSAGARPRDPRRRAGLPGGGGGGGAGGAGPPPGGAGARWGRRV